MSRITFGQVVVAFLNYLRTSAFVQRQAYIFILCLFLCLENASSDTIRTSYMDRKIFIGALFPRSAFTSHYEHVFHGAIRHLNTQPEVSYENVSFQGVVGRADDNPDSLLKTLCNDVVGNHVGFIISYFDSPMMTCTSAYTKIPVLLLRSAHPFRQETKPMHLYLVPSPRSEAQAILAVLDQRQWREFTVISDQSAARVALVRQIRELTNTEFQLNFRNLLSFKRNNLTAHKLYVLLGNITNTSVIVLLCSVSDARRIFTIARWLNMTGNTYTWIVTDDIFTHMKRNTKLYPTDVIAVSYFGQHPFASLIVDAVNVGSAAVMEALRERSNIPEFTGNCLADYPYNPGGEMLYRYISGITYQGRTGYISFDEEGFNARPHMEVWTLNKKYLRWRHWFQIGSWQNRYLQLFDENSDDLRTSLRVHSRKLHLRVVTFPERPFVNIGNLTGNGSCINGIPCLVPKSSDPKYIEYLFHKYASQKHLQHSQRTVPMYCCFGISIDILRKLGEDMKFDYNLYVAKGNQSGIMVDGSWTGAIYDVINRGADMIVGPLFVNSQRQQVLDISTPYFYTSFSLMVSRRGSDVSMSAFLEPFDWSMWIGTFVTANIVAISITLYEWHSPFGLTPRGRDRQRVFSMASALTLCWSILFSHTVATKKPKCWSSKFITNSWACFCVVFLASYTANLAAFMVGELKVGELSGIHDRRIQHPSTDYRIGVINNSNAELYLRTHYPHLFPQLNKYRAATTAEAIQKLSEDKVDVFIGDQTVMHYHRRILQDPNLRLIGKDFGNDAYAVGLPKNSDLTKRVDLMISKYVDDGSLEECIKLWLHDIPGCKMHLGEREIALSVVTFAGVFILFSVGIALGFVTLIFEFISYRYLVPYLRRNQSLNWLAYSQRLHRTLNSLPPTSKNTYTQRKGIVLRPIGERLSYYYARRDSGENSYDISRIIGSNVKRSNTRRRLSSSISQFLHRKPATQNTAVQTDIVDIVNYQLRDFDASIELRLLSFEKDLRDLRERLACALTEKEELLHRLSCHEAKSRDQLEHELQQRTRGYGFGIYGRTSPNVQLHLGSKKHRQVRFSTQNDCC